MYKSQNDMFTTFTDIFRSVIDEHAPLKTKIIKRNQASFMTKSLSKVTKTTAQSLSRWNNFCNILNKKLTTLFIFWPF